MSIPRRFVAFSLALPLLLSGCGSKAPAVPAEGAGATPEPEATVEDGADDRDFSNASAHIAKLIPSDTAIYIQLQSLPRFDELLASLARANDSLGRSIDEIGRVLHRQIPGDERHLMKDQPIGIAISLPPDREPEVTFVLPIKDLVSFKRSTQIAPNMPQPVFDGSYLAITSAEQYQRPREPVALAVGETDRTMVVRMDLIRLDRRFGSHLRLALTALAAGAEGDHLELLPADPRIRALLQEIADPVLYALAVGQQLDMSIEVSADRIEVDCAVQTRDAGVLSPWTSTEPVDLTRFARSLVASDTFAFVGGCDPSVLADRLAGLLSETELERERVAGLLESFAHLFGSLGAVSASLSAAESHIALHVNAADDPAFARGLASTFELFSRSGLGVLVKSKHVVTIEGVEVEDLLVNFDAASMCMLTGEKTDDLPAVQLRLNAVTQTLFGADAVHVRIASFGRHGLIAIGNDESWFRRTLLWAKEDKDLTPPDVRAALEHLGSIRAAAIVRLDMARWIQDHEDWTQQWRALSGPVRNLGIPGEAALHALDPQPLTVHLGAEGRTLRIGLSIGLSIDRTADMARR